MGGRRPRSPRTCARCSTNLTRGRPSSSTTRRVTAVRSSPRTRVRRLPARRRLSGVWPPAGASEPVAVGTQTALHVRCGALRAGRVDGSCGLLARRGPRRKACGERGGRRVGTLPMRTVSRQGAAHQDEVANSCIFNICHTAPGDERPRLAETFCGKLSLVNFISLYALHIAQLSTLVFPSAPFVLFML